MPPLGSALALTKSATELASCIVLPPGAALFNLLCDLILFPLKPERPLTLIGLASWFLSKMVPVAACLSPPISWVWFLLWAVYGLNFADWLVPNCVWILFIIWPFSKALFGCPALKPWRTYMKSEWPTLWFIPEKFIACLIAPRSETLCALVGLVWKVWPMLLPCNFYTE